MPYRSLSNVFKAWSIIFLSNLWHQLFHKSNQKHPSQQIKKWYTCTRYCTVALGIIMHCFLKMLSIFSTTFRLNWNFSFHKTIKHPQKSNPRKSIKFSGRMKRIFIFWFGFFHPSKEFDTLSVDDHLSNQLPILQIKSV